MNCIDIVGKKIYKFVLSIQLISNNKTTLVFIKNTYIKNKLKYINIILYYIRDLCRSNCIYISFVRSINIIANKLIKLLFKNKFKIFIR